MKILIGIDFLRKEMEFPIYHFGISFIQLQKNADFYKFS